MYAYTHAHIYIYVCVCVCTHTLMHTHTHTHTHIVQFVEITTVQLWLVDFLSSFVYTYPFRSSSTPWSNTSFEVAALKIKQIAKNNRLCQSTGVPSSSVGIMLYQSPLPLLVLCCHWSTLPLLVLCCISIILNKNKITHTQN